MCFLQNRGTVENNINALTFIDSAQFLRGCLTARWVKAAADRGSLRLPND